MERKKCNECRQTKPIAEFYFRTTLKGERVRKSRCKNCNRKKSALWRHLNRDRHNEVARLYRKSLPHPRKSAFRSEWRLRGFDPDAVENLVNTYGSKCFICGNPPRKRRLNIDHCDKHGVIRGLLCHKCNLGLGNFRDSVELLEQAIIYLKRAGCNDGSRLHSII